MVVCARSGVCVLCTERCVLCAACCVCCVLCAVCAVCFVLCRARRTPRRAQGEGLARRSAERVCVQGAVNDACVRLLALEHGTGVEHKVTR